MNFDIMKVFSRTSLMIQLIHVFLMMCYSQFTVAQGELKVGVYFLQSVETGMVLSGEDTSTEDGTKVVLESKKNNTFQKFRVEFRDNFYRIASIDNDSQFFLSPDPKVKSSSTVPLVFKDAGFNTLDMIIEPNADSSWSLSFSSLPGMYVSVPTQKTGQAIIQKISRTEKKAKWRLLPALVSGHYRIRNLGTGLYLDLATKTGASSKIVQKAYDKSDSQLFSVEELNGESNFKITSVLSRGSRYISVNKGRTTSSNPVGTQIFTSDINSYSDFIDNQSWEILNDGYADEDGFPFTIRSSYSASNNYIGVNSANDDKVVQTKPTKIDDNNIWIFEEVELKPFLEPGRYRIQHVKSGRFLEIDGRKTTSKAALKSTEEEEEFSQEFNVIQNGKFFQISPTNTYRKKWLTSNSNLQPFIDDSVPKDIQDWDIVFADYDLAESDVFTIRTANQNHFLTIEDGLESEKIVMKSSEEVVELDDDSNEELLKPTDDMFWQFVKVNPDGKIVDGVYLIQNTATKLVMDILGARQSNNTPLIQYDFNATQNQLFFVVEVEDGVFRLSPLHTNGKKWISVNGGTNPNRNAEGATLYQFDFLPNLQTFEIEPSNFVDEPEEVDYFSFTIKSRELSSNKFLGVNSSGDRRVVQSNTADSGRYGWRFIPIEDLKSSSIDGFSARLGVQAVNKEEIILFPNSVIDRFSIAVQNFDPAVDINLLIVDEFGNKVFQKSLGRVREFSSDVNYLGLNEGIYIVSVDDGTMKINKRLVITK